MVGSGRTERPPERRDQPALFGLQRCPFVACARSGLDTAAVPDVQAGFRGWREEVWRHAFLGRRVIGRGSEKNAFAFDLARVAHPAEAIGGVNPAYFDYRKPSIGRLRWRPI
jgi:hypothetical protein